VLRKVEGRERLASFQRPAVTLLVMTVVALALLVLAHSRLLREEPEPTHSHVRHGEVTRRQGLANELLNGRSPGQRIHSLGERIANRGTGRVGCRGAD
jgi:hypothetical protein